LRDDLSTAVRARVPLDEFHSALTQYETSMSGGKLFLVP
jgi:hypothetical protein